MRIISPGLLALACLAYAHGARAQYRPEPVFATTGHSVALSPVLRAWTVEGKPASVPRLIAGGVLGGLGGGTIGALAGSALFCEEETADDWCRSIGVVAGGLLGEAVGVPLGVQLADGGQGPWGWLVLPSFALAAMGLVLSEVYDSPSMDTAVLVAVPVAQIAIAVGTARRRTDREGG